eukprot:gene2610-3570_t
MEERETSEQILNLIKRNIKQRENESEEKYKNRITSVHHICLKTFATFSESNFHTKQELTISETIKKNFIKYNKINESLKFDELYNKILSKKNLKNENSVVYILYQIYLENNNKSGFESFLTPIVELPKKKLNLENEMKEKCRDLDFSENQLVKDLIFIFQGLDGKYLKFNSKNQVYEFSKRIDASKRIQNHIKQISEIGFLMKKIQSFINQKSNFSSLMSQSLVSSINTELTLFYKEISILESQIRNSDNFSLRRVTIWSKQPLDKLRLISRLLDAVDNTKGGILISKVSEFQKTGNPVIENLMNNISKQTSEPMFQIILNWIKYGEINDPFEEFFIKEKKCTKEEFWNSKYEICEEMIPEFITKKLSKEIFLIGKSLNFMQHHSGEMNSIILMNDKIKVDDINSIEKLEKVVGNYLKVTNSNLMKFLKNCRIDQHLLGLKNYLFLSEGNFIQHLMDLLNTTLNKSVTQINRSILLQILETTIKECGMNEDNISIKALDVKILKDPKFIIGWDAFSLDYHFDSPLNIIFSEKIMDKYLIIFKYLWNLKRIENLLTKSWKKGIKNSISNTSDFIRFKMLHFLRNLQYYYSFEVLESYWNDLVCKMNDILREGDLDVLIKTHEEYIENVFKSLMIEKSDIQNIISKFLNLMIQYLNFESSIVKIDSKVESNFILIEQKFEMLSSQLQNITKFNSFKLTIDFR